MISNLQGIVKLHLDLPNSMTFSKFLQAMIARLGHHRAIKNTMCCRWGYE
jgi:hypothetical protein